ncbi:HNH endonuclease signature motif containing protein [Arthrobacter sp. NEB 688]|uniref:HNH endonuclease signature motif containing protein n=1 Tax=Arthrobacter sp. NEB 688 TaxID=904039 RepID=UPI001564D6CF|nr:HNH endonuclease signature motif containing protein [Arthrobacter sp. NEB 688]QKE85608.1 HNH endonuclease [Arthrobacter sp. NEB 688]
MLATTADGTLLTPENVRRLGCDAALLVHLLGTRGEPLTLTRILRLFTRGQRRHLLLRDRGCTYPGCTAPAAWTRAHHVHDWADGGPTDITNAALLCERHHTLVHRRRLWATVREHPDDHGTHVTWDLTPHSYDRHLDTLRHPPDDRASPAA